MTPNQLIAIAAIVVSSATALIIGYLHRKQMRQNELYRQNAAVGLLPPPSPPVAFFKRYSNPILGLGIPLLLLAWLLSSNGPEEKITALTAAAISAGFFGILNHLQVRSEVGLYKD